MAKTNFTKVEEAFNDGLRKLTVEQLLKLTEVGYDKPEVVREQICILIIHEADRLYKKDNKIYAKLGIPYIDLKKKLAKPKELSDDQWKEIVEIKKKLDDFSAEIDKAKPDPSDDDLVEKERVKHINKRYNVKDRWLPLK